MALVGTMTLAAAVSTSGTWPALSRSACRVVGREHPVAVPGDADGHDVVAVAVERLEDAGGRRARHGVLRGAAPEDEGDAGPAGRVPVAGRLGAVLVGAHRPRLYPLARSRRARLAGHRPSPACGSAADLAPVRAHGIP